MALLKRIQLSDVYYYNDATNAWVAAKVKKGTSAEVTINASNMIDLFNNAVTPIDSSSGYSANIDWTSLNMMIADAVASDPGYTIFSDTVTGMVTSTAKSIKLRYKIKATSDAGSSTTSAEYYYQLIKFSHNPATNYLSQFPSTNGSATLVSPRLAIYMPAFDAASGDDASGAISNIDNWVVRFGTNNTTPESNPIKTISSISLAASEASSDAHLGDFKRQVTLTLQNITGLLSGTTYYAYAYFKPNDQINPNAVNVPDRMSCVVTVTVGTPSTATSIYSPDAAVAFNITFA